MFTYNQLFSAELLLYFNTFKDDFKKIMSEDPSMWQTVFYSACQSILDAIGIDQIEIPIKKSAYNNENKADIYVVEYDDIFVNRDGDAYCICLTFDGDNFRLFGLEKVLKGEEETIHFVEYFKDRTKKQIFVEDSKSMVRLCLDVIKVINL